RLCERTMLISRLALRSAPVVLSTFAVMWRLRLASLRSHPFPTQLKPKRPPTSTIKFCNCTSFFEPPESQQNINGQKPAIRANGTLPGREAPVFPAARVAILPGAGGLQANRFDAADPGLALASAAVSTPPPAVAVRGSFRATRWFGPGGVTARGLRRVSPPPRRQTRRKAGRAALWSRRPQREMRPAGRGLF